MKNNIIMLLIVSFIATGCATSLVGTIRQGDLNKVKKMVDSGANVNEKINGWSPLMRAVFYSNYYIAKYLVEKGAEVNYQKGLAQTGSEKRFDKFTSLHFACFYESLEIVTLLIENGADPNLKDAAGKLPIDYARDFSYTDIVAYLENRSK